MLWKMQVKDTGSFDLNGLPGDLFKIRGVNKCGHSDWTERISF